MTDEHPRICRTPDEAFQAGQDLVRRMGWTLSQRQREKCWALLRPYADQLLTPRDDSAA